MEAQASPGRTQAALQDGGVRESAAGGLLPRKRRIRRIGRFRIPGGVMPLLVVQGESLVAIGTGFVITLDGLMMTAAHVIEEAVKYGIPRVQDGKLDYDLQLYAVYITNQRHNDNDQYIGGPLPFFNFGVRPS